MKLWCCVTLSLWVDFGGAARLKHEAAALVSQNVTGGEFDLSSAYVNFFQTVGLPTGLFEGDAAVIGATGNCKWLSGLDGKYKDAFVVGQGATACVYLATERRSSMTVAIKIAKVSNQLQMWQKECREMQMLRLAACSAGVQAQQLAENFLPTCVDVGAHASSAYYVMQAAGTTGISDKARQVQHNKPLQKSIFAQTVAAVYALHGIGYTHNDLHGHNIVLDGTRVALIDFGEVKSHHRGLGYKHDANSVWRWAAVLAGCPENAQYPRLMKNFFSSKNKAELKSRASELLTCLKREWNADAEFIQAMQMMTTEAIKITSNQHLEDVYTSKFIQSNLPALEKVYPWDGEGRCKESGTRAARPTTKAAPSGNSGKKNSTGRPTKGDKVKDKTSGKCATIIVDDKDATPYKLKYSDGSTNTRFFS